MSKRFVTIWFRHLKTDWFCRRQPSLINIPFVLSAPDHGRMIVTAINVAAGKLGIFPGNVVADARAIFPGLQVFDDKPELEMKLLTAFAKFCIRFTPAVAIDPPDGLILDVSGCPHLWGGDEHYITTINNRFNNLGYNVRVSMADTIGTAWAVSRYGQMKTNIESGDQINTLFPLPPAALRLENDITEQLQKLGLRKIENFIGMPRSVLRRRFGAHLLKRLDQATGYEEELIDPVQPIEPYQERLNCLEPIITVTGIEIALQRLLESLCHRLQQEEKGIRLATFKCYRIDGKTEEITIGTHRASHHSTHLFKLFELKISTIEPALGIELFTLDATKVEDLSPLQKKLWEGSCGLEDIRFSELLDRIAGKIGASHIHRYLPDEHYWPERSVRKASSVYEAVTTTWSVSKPRPTQLLSKPEPIEVTAPVPDYPPMLFRYKGKLHKVKKADGPERIEPEWWLEEGEHRDYYSVEDEDGCRYWLFRSGHYTVENKPQWFIHGYFA